MTVAIIGADAPALCGTVGGYAQPFSTLAGAIGRDWDIVALMRGAAKTPLSGALYAHCLILPGDSDLSVVRSLHALQIVGYGFSPRDTLTLSSVTGAGRLLCLQRSLLALDGSLIEPQELPLTPALSALDAENALLAAGILLLSYGELL